ncbi:MAG: metallophosphoesterase family protein [Gemmatimonadota bacterium]
MRRLFLADVHANLPAFEAVLEQAGPADEVYFLGDVVGCGPHPSACVDLLDSLGARALCGNHDAAVLAAAGAAGYPRAGDWDHWTCAQLRPDQRRYLASLASRLTVWSCGRQATLIHRSAAAHYLHPDMADDLVAAYFDGVPGEAVYCGHSHRLLDRTLEGRRLVCLPPVGQPRNRDPRAGYAVEEDGRLRFGFVEYEVERVVGDLGRIGLPAAYRRRWESFLRQAWDPEWSREYVPGPSPAASGAAAPGDRG